MTSTVFPIATCLSLYLFSCFSLIEAANWTGNKVNNLIFCVYFCDEKGRVEKFNIDNFCAVLPVALFVVQTKMPRTVTAPPSTHIMFAMCGTFIFEPWKMAEAGSCPPSRILRDAVTGRHVHSVFSVSCLCCFASFNISSAVAPVSCAGKPLITFQP